MSINGCDRICENLELCCSVWQPGAMCSQLQLLSLKLNQHLKNQFLSHIHCISKWSVATCGCHIAQHRYRAISSTQKVLLDSTY